MSYPPKVLDWFIIENESGSIHGVCELREDGHCWLYADDPEGLMSAINDVDDFYQQKQHYKNIEGWIVKDRP